MRAQAIVVLTFLLFSITTAHAATQKVLYTFTGGPDGGQPFAGLVFDNAGDLYGVTQTGGAFNKGTVFELTPTPGGWSETVLYSFTGGADGSTPIGGLAIDDNGDLFGTTSSGADPTNCGTLFELSGARFTVLHTFVNFRSSDGCAPTAKLFWVPGVPGALWGTTMFGGRRYGAFFSFDLDGNTFSSTAFSFRNGEFTSGGLNEWGYGATPDAGKAFVGDVYRAFPKMKIIHSFNQQDNVGYNPSGELLTATVAGVPTMYGTNTVGSVGGHGSVYALVQSPKGTWLAKVLHSFSGPDGDSPGAGLVGDSVGNLYGTTTQGGTDPGSGGTIFQLAPGPNNTWIHTLLYSFRGGADGGKVTSGVIRDSAGNLYGTTLAGGTNGQGVVYEIVP